MYSYILHGHHPKPEAIAVPISGFALQRRRQYGMDDAWPAVRPPYLDS